MIAEDLDMIYPTDFKQKLEQEIRASNASDYFSDRVLGNFQPQPHTIRTYLYTKSSAARILGCKPSKIAEVKMTPELDSKKLVLVKFKSGGQQFLGQAKFKENFDATRQERGREIVVTPYFGERTFTARSQRDGSLYEITVHDKYVSCTCEDWAIQQGLGIKSPMCKHSYAALYRLGCNSLSEWRSRNSELAAVAA